MPAVSGQSITSDYVISEGNPEPYLRRIAEAGFTHIHWCHHWHTDFVYQEPEMAQIQAWFQEFGLQLNDVHGSDGVEKAWASSVEYQRRAGVELVKNRMELAHRLGADVVIMHVFEPEEPEARPRFWEQIRRTLDDLAPFARERGVRLALENLPRLRSDASDPPTAQDVEYNFGALSRLFQEYGPDYVGMCFDSGHAHIGQDQLDQVAALADRIIALHLHDNDGAGDQHRIPFTGTLDWERVTEIVARSPYAKPISQEVVIHHSGIQDERTFLRETLEAGKRLAEMVQEKRRQMEDGERRRGD